uniref:Uncharacterized protein n=1 Tax=Sus scrofa TaxID=9823 RepID=A0A8D0VL33_PIG
MQTIIVFGVDRKVCPRSQDIYKGCWWTWTVSGQRNHLHLQPVCAKEDEAGQPARQNGQRAFGSHLALRPACASPATRDGSFWPAERGIMQSQAPNNHVLSRNSPSCHR